MSSHILRYGRLVQMRRVGLFVAFVGLFTGLSCKSPDRPPPPRKPPVEAPSEPDPADDPNIALPIYSEPLPAGLAPHAIRLQKRATEGDDGAALELGEWMVHGDGIPPDALRAAGIFGTLCHRKNADGCGHLADLYMRGVGVRRHRGHAIKMFDDACANGSAWACSRIGGERLWATSVGFDLEKGLAQAKKGCDGLDPLGCYVVERAIYKGITKDGDKTTRRSLLLKAEAARLAACRAKNKFYTCALNAKDEWIADRSDRRYGGDPELQDDDAGSLATTTDDAGASREAEEACLGGDYHACVFRAGSAGYARNQRACADGDYRACNAGLPGDPEKLCRSGNCEACFDLGRETDAKTDKYKLAFQAACELGCLEGCSAYVEHAHPEKEVASRRLFACDHHLASACVELASSDSTKDAMLLLLRACPDPPRYTRGGDFSAKACRLAGDSLVHSSPGEAEKMYLRACYAAAPSFEACRRLGDLAESKKENEKALIYYAAACLPNESQPHDRMSCVKARELASALPYLQRAKVVERLNKMVGPDGGAPK